MSQQPGGAPSAVPTKAGGAPPSAYPPPSAAGAWGGPPPGGPWGGPPPSGAWGGPPPSGAWGGPPPSGAWGGPPPSGAPGGGPPGGAGGPGARHQGTYPPPPTPAGGAPKTGGGAPAAAPPGTGAHPPPYGYPGGPGGGAWGHPPPGAWGPPPPGAWGPPPGAWGGGAPWGGAPPHGAYGAAPGAAAWGGPPPSAGGPRAGPDGFPIGNALVKLGAGWGIPGDVDMDIDLACFVLDGGGGLLDVVFFRHLSSNDGAINHSGDNRTGEGEGDDEQILFDLPRVRPDAAFLVLAITMQTPGATLSHVKNGFCRVFIPTPDARSNTGKQLCHFKLDPAALGGNASFVMGIFHRDRAHPGNWLLKQLSRGIAAQGLDHLLPQLDSALDGFVSPEVMRSRNNPGAAKSLSKGDDLAIPVKRIRMGLGWDTGSRTMDLDAWCYMRDGKDRKVDTVYYHALRSKDGAVVHSGDNLTGRGDGDDEQITVDLSKMNPKVTVLYFVVKIYHRPLSRKSTFKDVRNPFVRMLDVEGGKARVMCRFDIKDVAKGSDALCVCKVYRVVENVWRFQALGIGSKADKIHERLQSFKMDYGLAAKIGASSSALRGTKWNIAVVAGRNLAAMDTSGTSDPYPYIEWGGKKKKGSKVRKTLNPTWNFTTVMNHSPKKLEISVWDWDRFSADDFMGRVKLHVSGALDQWIPLTGSGAKGEIHVKISPATH